MKTADSLFTCPAHAQSVFSRPTVFDCPECQPLRHSLIPFLERYTYGCILYSITLKGAPLPSIVMSSVRHFAHFPLRESTGLATGGENPTLSFFVCIVCIPQRFLASFFRALCWWWLVCFRQSFSCVSTSVFFVASFNFLYFPFLLFTTQLTPYQKNTELLLFCLKRSGMHDCICDQNSAWVGKEPCTDTGY